LNGYKRHHWVQPRLFMHSTSAQLKFW
jgi:hypothetical protein